MGYPSQDPYPKCTHIGTEDFTLLISNPQLLCAILSSGLIQSIHQWSPLHHSQICRKVHLMCSFPALKHWQISMDPWPALLGFLNLPGHESTLIPPTMVKTGS